MHLPLSVNNPFERRLFQEALFKFTRKSQNAKNSPRETVLKYNAAAVLKSLKRFHIQFFERPGINFNLMRSTKSDDVGRNGYGKPKRPFIVYIVLSM